jgi:CheY-like chemotaxis protein
VARRGVLKPAEDRLRFSREMAHRVLVVEDGEVLAESIVMGLREEGYTVERAAVRDTTPNQIARPSSV